MGSGHVTRRFRCPTCRTRRTSFVLLLKHCADRGHQVCGCGGYHYPHRAGSPCCDAHPMAVVHRALREGGLTDDELLDIQMDAALDSPGKRFEKWKG